MKLRRLLPLVLRLPAAQPSVRSTQLDPRATALKLKGWTDADTAAFVAARQAFGPVQSTRAAAKSDAEDSTSRKNSAVADLYEWLLTIQNAADLHWLSAALANAGVRDEFRLNTFPPASGGATPTPSPTPPAPPKP